MKPSKKERHVLELAPHRFPVPFQGPPAKIAGPLQKNFIYFCHICEDEKIPPIRWNSINVLEHNRKNVILRRRLTFETCS
jgi:hypothetical protein